MMKKIFLKYIILKVRNKISYIAFHKKQTICELFIRAIYASYTILVRVGDLEPIEDETEVQKNYDKIINSDYASTFKAVMGVNNLLMKNMLLT